MAGTRALFASIGAGAALVAAAALSLLTISAVFAFGGWSAPASHFNNQPALVLAQVSASDGAAAGPGTTIVAPPPARRAQRREDPRPSAPRPSTNGAPRPAVSGGQPTAVVNPPPPPPPPPTPVEPAARPAPKAGDHVRKAGDSLSATVEGTGAALATITQPLAAPVSAAVQQVLNVLAEVVNRATEGLGAGIDTLVAPKQ